MKHNYHIMESVNFFENARDNMIDALNNAESMKHWLFHSIKNTFDARKFTNADEYVSEYKRRLSLHIKDIQEKIFMMKKYL